ncbi:DNA adenine methylase [Virgibacillus halodenitrificans]|uniref:DNA adenine methylase n=1 Tax=Virgibacillus halodenitrificans TaxID=1482 RepID=UPI000EF510C4|nr:DNA adenine methylase [Virgibacillus halodenitrificans]
MTLANTKSITSPIKWFGGKHYMAKEIISLLPNHKVYVEPFGGGGHILTQKKSSKIEVYNDIDADLVNFLMVLRNRRDELIERLADLPSSRFLCQKWQREPLPEDELERATKWFYLLRQRISPRNASLVSGWRASKDISTAVDYQNALKKLKAFEERWRRVMIECVDFRRVFEIYDSPDTVFVVDPPYVGKESQYKGNFSYQDHVELAEILSNIQGNAIVTYYECDLVNRLYSGWNRVKKDGYVGSSVVKNKEKRKIEKELILMNFEEVQQLSFF